MADQESKLLVIAGVAIGGWWLWQNGYLAQWFGSSFAPTATVPASATAPVTTTTPPTTTAATVTLVSNPVAGINNSLQAQVSINGTVMTLSVIPSAGSVWNTSGQNITSQLQAEGVNVSNLIAMMQAAYNPPATAPSTSTTASSTTAPSTSGLTPQNAAVTPYNSSLNSTISNSTFQSQLDAMLSAGQISQFAGNSVIAYMWGLGADSQGQTVTYPGTSVQYAYDGTNWNLVGAGGAGSGTSGLSGNRVPAVLIHGQFGTARVPRRFLQ